MDLPQAPSLIPIRAVPGLFISDRSGASSTKNLEAYSIVRILSALQPHETWRSNNFLNAGTSVESNRSPGVASLAVKTIEIDDDPFVDILQYLEEVCDWIEAGLGQDGDSEGYVPGNRPQTGVLVHCRQGISRSGAFVVAFLMRKFKLSYSAALNLSRESRPEICPNIGFEKQLRIWEFCQYKVFLDDDRKKGEQTICRKKPSYKTWIAERDNLLQRGEEDVNRARFSSLASMAARFGKRRQEEVAGEQQKDTSKDGGMDSVEQNRRKESWERVKKMEQDWNARLIRSQIHAEVDEIQAPKE